MLPGGAESLEPLIFLVEVFCAVFGFGVDDFGSSLILVPPPRPLLAGFVLSPSFDSFSLL